MNSSKKIPKGQLKGIVKTVNSVAPDLDGNVNVTVPNLDGGLTGQILSKNTDANLDFVWIDNYTSTLKHTVKAATSINKGQAVYVSSAEGTNMIVSKASNTSEATSSKTLGLLYQTLAVNGQGFVIAEGLLAGLNTSTATAGDSVWLGVDGNLIFGLANKPYAPAHLVFIGIVTRVSATVGEIFVKVQNGFELNEIHDVDLKTNVPVNGDVLGYNGTLWVNKTIAGWLGFTPVPTIRTLTINGTTFDLSADRIFSVGTVTSVAALTLGTSGTDLSSTISNSSTTPVITLNIPTASATNRGVLSSADWTSFNNKIAGSGTTNYLSKFTASGIIGNSLVYDNGTNVGINNITPAASLDINGNLNINYTSTFSSTSGNVAANSFMGLTIPAASTFQNGRAYIGSSNTSDIKWEGSNSIPNGVMMSGFLAINRNSFTAPSGSITLSQNGSNIRAISAMQVLQQTVGTYNGTISHGAGIFVQGIYPGSAANVTFNNYYGLLINDLNEWGGVTFNNRWGIYQSGALDKNHFNGNVLIGSTIDDGTNKLQVNGSASFTGNVGIGTTSPTEKLTIASLSYPAVGFYRDIDVTQGGGASQRIIIGARKNGTYTGAASIDGVLLAGGNDGVMLLSTLTSSSLTEKMRITSTGNVLINTIADDGTNKLQVVGGVRFSSLSGTGNRAVYADATGILTNTASDIRLKKNIEDIKYSIVDVMKLRAVNYNWIDEKRGIEKEIGFIAQEVKEVIPEVVGQNSDGNFSVDYAKMVSLLTKAIQEQQIQIELLKQEIELLKQK